MTHLTMQKLQKGDIPQQHIDTLAMCWWVISPFCNCLSNAMHGQNINLPVCVCVCVCVWFIINVTVEHRTDQTGSC